LQKSISLREVLFQVVLHALVFSFYSFDKKQPQIQFHKVVFFLNYALANLVISYFLLPRYFYRKRYLQFLLGVVVVVFLNVVIEEMVLEQIFFPDTRAQKFYIFYTILNTLPVITILAGGKFAWDALKKQREVDELKAVVEESELQFLKSQINPHFLFNNLNNLYSYAIENSPKTPEIILELSAVLRYMLYECKEKYVSLHKEIEQLKNFTQLNTLQIEDRGTITFDAPIETYGYKIAPLILIVFIENAFKHSQSSQSENISITVEIELTKTGQLDFYCKNNFLPTTNTDSLSNGIGLANVQKRLQLLYPQKHELTINDADQ